MAHACTTQGKILSEDDVRTASQQYDAGFIYHASLPRQGLCEVELSAFARCTSLQLLDISGNKLPTLAGLAPIAAQLTFLNAAENRLVDISALAACTALERCYLEGNELTSVSALRVLVALPSLVELVLQRTVPLPGSDPQETLLLDNPVCHAVETYEDDFLRQVPHVRWVDGVPAFLRRKRFAENRGDGADGEADGAASNETLLSAAAASHAAAMQEMTRNNDEEGKLCKLLADAAAKCKKACNA